MRDIKSILEGIVSQGKTVGSGGSSFRDRSSSNDKSGLNIGANRAQSHERAAKEASADRADNREDEVEKRNREAKQRQKETMKMSKEETVTEAKHVFHVHLHADDTRLGKMVDDKTVEPIGAKPKGTKIKLTVPAHDTRTARDKATRYAAKNFGVDSVKSIEYKGLHEDTVVEANIGPNVDTETIRGIHQRAHASITNPNNKKLTYSHPGFADQIDNELKARKELAKRGIKVERPKHRAVIEHNLDEAIKGWKNAASDIRKQRSAASDAKKSAMLVSLKKDGNESGMHDAKSYHASEEEARKKHETITKLNPNRKIRHNLYVDGKKVDTLGEETNTEKREKIENVARMDGAKPTSEKSTLSKTGQIKTKIVEEKPTMSLPNFGLPQSLIDAVRQIVEKKDEDEKDPKKMTGGKTVVDTDPETDDKQNDDDAAAKGKKKAVKEETKSHTIPKTDKEKKLAALASPKDKITHKDVLVGRGVVKEEEVEEIDLSVTEEQIYEALIDEGDLSVRALYNKMGGDKSNKPVHKAIQKVHGAATLGHLKKAFSANMRGDFDKEEGHFEKARASSGKKDAIGATVGKNRSAFRKANEEVDQLDELKRSTLASYVKKAATSSGSPRDLEHLGQITKTHPDARDKILNKMQNRQTGIVKAADRLAKEEVEFSEEELARIADIASSFQTEIDEAVKKSSAPTTATSAPIRGANQDQSGFNTKNSTADYTISDSKKMKVKEEVEELDELEKSTLGSYVKKAKDSLVKNRQGYSDALNKPGYTSDDRRYFSKKSSNRARGIDKAVDKLTEEEVDLEEAIKIGSRVKVHAPGKDYHGVIGNVGEIDHGLHKKSEKKYTVDYNNRSNSVTLPKSQIKLHTEEVELEEGRGRPRKNPLPAGQAADVDDTNKHPMQQLEKIAHSIEGREPHFEHKDDSKTKVGRHLARHMVAVHNSMKTTQEKDDFANKLHANRDSMRSAMSKHF